MQPSYIEHIGIAVSKLDEVIPYYEQILGTKCYSIEEVADQKVRTAFFKVGQTKIELLEPTCPESTIAKWLEKNPRGGVHHIAFNVDDVQAALTECEENGIQLIDKTPRKGAENLNIGFLHPKSTHGVLTEQCEQPK
ncbi:MAG: methylmalonyl-CoA epimerase [Paludibacteraceae bacterium]|nr:methylmalonyl-CoA epimerase [Paludibacteraceae bacterium]